MVTHFNVELQYLGEVVRTGVQATRRGYCRERCSNTRTESADR